ncbi:MAG: hypothetical protein EZS28_024057 [Streblomastix strix]|uniref:Uncharacterized protein n=1 Tax=Streblomastix strix TaxID=222440 RepID=A0A5J4VD49_9EUKA|nr:MAG: hypothetical protein EZS28_024057 [Streblomastix strix]
MSLCLIIDESPPSDDDNDIYSTNRYIVPHFATLKQQVCIFCKRSVSEAVFLECSNCQFKGHPLCWKNKLSQVYDSLPNSLEKPSLDIKQNSFSECSIDVDLSLSK